MQVWSGAGQPWDNHDGLEAQHKKLASMGSHLILVSPTPMARRLLEITGLTQVLTIEPIKQVTVAPR